MADHQQKILPSPRDWREDANAYPMQTRLQRIAGVRHAGTRYPKRPDSVMGFGEIVPGRYLAVACLALVMHSAGAIDIPMNKVLAMEALDSKTCYSTVKNGRQLLGYELNELLVSSSGKLAKLEAIGSAGVGDGQARRYRGHGIEVTIVPRKIASHEDDDQELYITLEEGYAVIREHGRQRRLQVKVSQICTP